MTGLSRILLSIACTGILQTALVTADVQADRACIAAAAASSEDNSDCSRTGTSNSTPRHHLSLLVLEDRPPKPKGFVARHIELAASIQPDDSSESTFSGFSLPTTPVYLATRRIRV